FDPKNLPRGLKELDLSGNALTSFDPTKLTKNISLNLEKNKLTKEKKEEIKKWWKDNGKINGLDL
ncbi:MAG: hypothetical protein GY679_04660, partial [Mycoplasma sp.]|nr:hypothetical protein [Mycoplasma sp.]